MTKSDKQFLIIISSPSGAGKTTICKRLLKMDKFLKVSISDTTRPPRSNEVEGKDYNFIDEKEFKDRIEKDLYAEFANVFGNYYGSLKKNVKNILDSGKDVLFDIDWQGAAQLRQSEFKNILSIFLIPPTKASIYERLKSRAELSGDDLSVINKRMDMYDTEMSHRNEYDFIVTNNDLEECVSQIISIINKVRLGN